MWWKVQEDEKEMGQEWGKGGGALKAKGHRELGVHA